jgi:hypothetical protein
MLAGVASYGKKLGRWWVKKAEDEGHVDAYRHVAKWLGRKLPRAPKSILDYACGAGHLTLELRHRFPRARITGYDGAMELLVKAQERLGADPRLTLSAKLLPDLEDRHPRSDLTVFCFPHLLPPDDAAPVRRYAKRHQREARAARKVAKAMRREGHWDKDTALRWHVENTLFERMAARHLFRLTRTGGHCAFVGYSQAALDEIEATYLDYLRFSEGFATSVRGVRVKRFFRPVADTYVRSPVISDVSDQEGSADEDEGGYMICLFEAV